MIIWINGNRQKMLQPSNLVKLNKKYKSRKNLIQIDIDMSIRSYNFLSQVKAVVCWVTAEPYRNFLKNFLFIYKNIFPLNLFKNKPFAFCAQTRQPFVQKQPCRIWMKMTLHVLCSPHPFFFESTESERPIAILQGTQIKAHVLVLMK